MRTIRVLLGGWIAGGAILVLLSLGDVVAEQPGVTSDAVEGSSARAAGAGSLDVARDDTRSLIIPVRGIAAHQLKDTFTQARGRGRSHGAMDILAPRGTEVLAAVDGRIRKLFNSKAGGITIYQFDQAEQRVYYYAHLDRYADGLAEGQFVEQGTVIGYVGTTGNAPPGTPHLHFAIEELTAEKLWWKATPVNPFPLLTR